MNCARSVLPGGCSENTEKSVPAVSFTPCALHPTSVALAADPAEDARNSKIATTKAQIATPRIQAAGWQHLRQDRFKSSNRGIRRAIKTDGTTPGTVHVTDSSNTFKGANADYLFTSYSSFSVFPFVYTYKRTDGIAVGSSVVSDNLGKSASFNIITTKKFSCSCLGTISTP